MSESASVSGCGASRASAGPGRPCVARLFGSVPAALSAARPPLQAALAVPGRRLAASPATWRPLKAGPASPGPEPAIRPSQHRALRGVGAPTAPCAAMRDTRIHRVRSSPVITSRTYRFSWTVDRQATAEGGARRPQRKRAQRVRTGEHASAAMPAAVACRSTVHEKR